MTSGDRILTERHMPEKKGVLGSTSTSKEESGILREIGVAFCDYCGMRIDVEGNIAICPCGRKLDERCLIHVSGRGLCPDCAMDELNLSKRSLKVLAGIGLSYSNSEIERNFHLTFSELFDTYSILKKRGLARRKFPAFIRGYRLTDEGASVYPVCVRLLKKFGELPDTVSLYPVSE